MKKLSLVLAVLVFTLGFSTISFAADTSTEITTSIDSSISADTTKDTTVAPSEAKDDVVKVSEEKSFKKLYATEMATLATLRTEAKANWNTIKAKNAEIKSSFTALKAALKGNKNSKTILTDLKAKLTALRAKVTAIHTDIKSIRAAKIAAWAEFRAAVKAKDKAASKVAIDKILSLKSQIIEKQKLILSTKGEILAAIVAATPVK